MNNLKHSFVLYNDYIDTTDELSDEEAGKLFKMILAKVNDRQIECDSKLLRLIFKPIEKAIDRDLQKYENKIQEKSNAGQIGNLKRWNRDLYNDFQKGKIDLDEALKIAKHRKTSQSDKSVAKVAVSDSDNDSENVSDNVSVSDLNGKNQINKKDSYSYEEFLRDFIEIRSEFEEDSIKISFLNTKEKEFFDQFNEIYSRKDFRKGLTGLFWQEPKAYPQVRNRPAHFLENLETYLDCYSNKIRNHFSKENVGPMRHTSTAPKRF
ncbi:MAG: DUF6291 domain-containing protein [Christiangramia sp.]|uniref:DUF6291 domain-containing protein n=1 Tax=Christiangramia sp. TaxID=1931228 RepID=UPI003242D1B8